MKIAYFDLIAGASGDMMLGALIDAGLSQEDLQNSLSTLNLNDFELNIQKLVKNGFGATKVDVNVSDNVPERHLPQIEQIITSSNLPLSIKKRAIAIFHKLGIVEAEIHGTSIDRVHLHELGGVDTVVDVVGVLSGLEILGIEKVYASPVPLGRGFVRGAHGQIPLPAPATIALLKNVPIHGVEIDKELVTPTGAVLLTSLAAAFDKIPHMKLESIGYGAGGRDLPIPNLLRVLIGESTDDDTISFQPLVILETNIDDQNPEIFSFVMDRLFSNGALDVFFTSIQMKKNRPGTMIQVLAKPEDITRLRNILFEETSTLGIRQKMFERYALEREIKEVRTAYGEVQVKVAQLGGGKIKIAPEFDDCRRLAELHQVPVREIYFAAEEAARRLS
jgi:uncharacterized protein (TIGR00299 family) protein